MEKTTKLLELKNNGALELKLPPEIMDRLGWNKNDLINISLVEDAIFLVKLTQKAACCKDNFEDLAVIRL